MNDQPATSDQTLRFTLVHVMYLITLLAAAFALFETYAVGWLLIVLVFWLYWFASNAHALVKVLWIIFFLLFVACLNLPVLGTPKVVAWRSVCCNNLRMLALALLNYEAAHQNFPPAYQSDASERPMHSWRVSILPYLEQGQLHDQYDWTEKWNGPNNSKLVGLVGGADHWFCPYQFDKHQNKTPYKLITGKGTGFEDDKTTTIAQFQLLSNTIAIIEDLGDSVCWMEPRDLTIDEAVKLFDVNQETPPEHIKKTKFYQIVTYHRSVAFFDGHVTNVGCLEDPQQIVPYLMLDHPDKDDFSKLKFIYPKPTYTVLYSGYFLLAFNLYLAVLPCWWKRLQLRANEDRVLTSNAN